MRGEMMKGRVASGGTKLTRASKSCQGGEGRSRARRRNYIHAVDDADQLDEASLAPLHICQSHLLPPHTDQLDAVANATLHYCPHVPCPPIADLCSNPKLFPPHTRMPLPLNSQTRMPYSPSFGRLSPFYSTEADASPPPSA